MNLKPFLGGLLAALASCVAPGSPLVASVDGSLNGNLRASPDAAVAVGEMHAHASMGFRTNTGLVWPLVLPLDVSKDEVLCIRRSPYLQVRQKLTDPLPDWAATLFAPGEWATIVAKHLATSGTTPEPPAGDNSGSASP
jgi:hypothetical protein